MKITDRLSPNFNERGGRKPDSIIIHYTGMRSAEEALDRLCDPKAEVSAHYVIDEDGTIYRLVFEDKRAWHAGKSCWEGETDLNACSIGIELVNPGHEFGYRAFSVRQMAALKELCRDIIARHDIPPHRVLAHSDVAPARKTDPGELFDWQMMAACGVGLWPQPERGDREPIPENRLREAFSAFGYDPQCDLKTVVTAFQRHFYPEIFKRPDRVGIAGPETVERLRCLLRLKNLHKP